MNKLMNESVHEEGKDEETKANQEIHRDEK